MSLGYAVNAFLIRGERHILIDTGNPGQEKKILKELSELDIDPADISLIIITHGHIDHLGGLSQLREVIGSPVAIHSSDADAIRHGKHPELIPRRFIGKLFLALQRNTDEIRGFKPFEPDLIIDGEMYLSEYGVDGRIIPTPGHTPGSLSVYLSSGEVIIGDLVMGIISKSRPKYPIFADDMEEVRSSIVKVLGLSPQIIYASHGGPFSPESVRSLLAGTRNSI